MLENREFLLVDAQALPEVFLKVVQAKRYLAQGKAKNASHAAQLAGISRSAFYKYKDAVRPYDQRESGNILTFSLTLEDRPGVLSVLLGEFYRAGANIVTLTQNLPVDGVAAVTVSVCTREGSREQLLDLFAAIDGIVEAKSIG